MTDERSDGTGIGRRRLLGYLGTGGAAGLAGCFFGGGGDSATTPAGTTAGNATGNATGTTGTPAGTEDENGTEEGPMPVGDTFTFATVSTAGPPHPLLASTAARRARLDPMFDGPGGQLGPDTFFPKWFESFSLNDAADTVTYRLRDGLTWGAGYGQLTADDYLYTLNNVVLLEGGDDWFGFTGTNSYRLGGEFVSYEKVDDRTFRADLPTSRPFWLHEDPLLNLVPLPRDLLDGYVPDPNEEGTFDDRREALVADEEINSGALSRGDSNLGPYSLMGRDSYEVGTRWEYQRNPDYYLTEYADEAVFSDPYYDFRNSPYFETFVYEVFDSGSGAVNDLSTGAVQGAELPARSVDIVANLRSRRPTIWQSRFGTDGVWLYLNHRIQKGWSQIRESREVRQAMANCFDREQVVDRVFEGNGVVAHTLHPQWGPFYPPLDRLFVPEGSIERARSLLASGTTTGYGYDERGRLMNPEGEQVSLTVVHPNNDEEALAAAQFMRSRLSGGDDGQGAGIELSPQGVDPATLERDYMENSPENAPGEDITQFDASRFNRGPWNRSASNEPWDLMVGPRFDTNPYAPWSAIRSQLAETGPLNFAGYHQYQDEEGDDFDVDQVALEAASADSRSTTQERLNVLFGYLSRDVPVAFSHTEFENLGFDGSIRNFPGTQTELGYEATSLFKRPDPVRLQSSF